MIVQNSLIAIFDRVLVLSAAFQKNFIMRLPRNLGVVSGLPRYYAVTYKQEFMFDVIGNMTSKTSTSDNPADKLRYRNDYEYGAGTHRAKRIGDWHYRYGADGQRALKYTVSGTDRSEVRYYNRMFQVSVLNGYAAESKHIYVGETRIVTKRKDAGNTGSTSQESK